MESKIITLRLPKELVNRYNKLAKFTGNSKSFHMNEALADSIDRLEYEYGLLQQVEDFRTGKLKTYSLEDLRTFFENGNGSEQ